VRRHRIIYGTLTHTLYAVSSRLLAADVYASRTTSPLQSYYPEIRLLEEFKNNVRSRAHRRHWHSHPMAGCGPQRTSARRSFPDHLRAASPRSPSPDTATYGRRHPCSRPGIINAHRSGQPIPSRGRGRSTSGDCERQSRVTPHCMSGRSHVHCIPSICFLSIEIVNYRRQNSGSGTSISRDVMWLCCRDDLAAARLPNVGRRRRHSYASAGTMTEHDQLNCARKRLGRSLYTHLPNAAHIFISSHPPPSWRSPTSSSPSPPPARSSAPFGLTRRLSERCVQSWRDNVSCSNPVTSFSMLGPKHCPSPMSIANGSSAGWSGLIPFHAICEPPSGSLTRPRSASRALCSGVESFSRISFLQRRSASKARLARCTALFFLQKFGNTEADSYRSILNGFDKDGRPIIWMTPAKENTPSSTRQLRHLVFVL
jgi:hypothetical protein